MSIYRGKYLLVQVYMAIKGLLNNEKINTNAFNDDVENVLNSESLFMINYVGRFNFVMLTGFLLFNAIENYYLVLLEQRISYLAYSYIPHLEIKGLI